MKSYHFMSIFLILILAFADGFQSLASIPSIRVARRTFMKSSTFSNRRLLASSISNVYDLRPTSAEKCRTIANICSSGTLCSIIPSSSPKPFGSHIDFIVDEEGCPIFTANQHTRELLGIKDSVQSAIHFQLHNSDATTGLNRVTILGSLESLSKSELPLVRLAYTLVHRHTEAILDSHNLTFFRLRPNEIYLARGLDENFHLVNLMDYQTAKPDVVAQEMECIICRLNAEKQQELALLSKEFLGIDAPHYARVYTVDRLGLDLRIQHGGVVSEFRVGYRHPQNVRSAEDAKSEIMKLFQEAWERNKGSQHFHSLPPILQYSGEPN